MYETETVIINVSFFKPNGKWYTDETMEFGRILHDLPHLSYYHCRTALEEILHKHADYKGMWAVCNDVEIFGYPFMVKVGNGSSGG